MSIETQIIEAKDVPGLDNKGLAAMVAALLSEHDEICGDPDLCLITALYRELIKRLERSTLQ